MGDEAADGTGVDSGGAPIGIAHIEAAAELRMRSGHLVFELRVALGETLGNNVIDEAITIDQGMAGLSASQACGRVGLVL